MTAPCTLEYIFDHHFSRKFLLPSLLRLSFLRLRVLMIDYSVNYGCHDDNEDRA